MPHADEAWRKTLEEVDAGTLVGSIKLNDVPDDYPLSKRFGIQQGQKIRCIDDFTRSSTNSCVQTCESPKLHTLDVFGALCVMAMASTGERRKWKGWTFDLVGAYRQGGTHALLFHTQSPRRSLPSGCELFRLELSGQSIHLACGLSWSRSSCWSWPPTTLTISFSLVRRGD